MNTGSSPSWGRAFSLQATVLLLLALVLLNAVAIWGILSARRGALETARHELQAETTAHGRALKAALATLRGDLLLLSQSPPLVRALHVFSSPDPLVRRWGRLDVEGTLLLFLEAHPAVEGLLVRAPSGEPWVVAGRRDGVPSLLPPTEASVGELEGPGTVRHRWPVPNLETGGTAWIETLLHPERLLDRTAPGLEDRLRVAVEAPGADAPVPAGLVVARSVIEEDAWDPPLAWMLERREETAALLGSVEALAGRYRSTVLLNLAILPLTLVVGALALRQARQSSRLAAENEQQVRLRELERQLLHSERLASVGRLAAGIAHEVNNPLAGMTNYLTLLEEELRDGRTEVAASLLPRLREGLERAAGVTGRVLALASPGTTAEGRAELAEVLRETVAFLGSRPELGQIEWRLEVPDYPLEVRVDGVTLGQVFLNLLLNAAQCQQGNGVVEVEVRQRAAEATVTVSDRGPGIPEEALPRLFEPFFSTRGSSGLGLALCRQIVEKHRGHIEAANRPGGGARFEVRLALASAAEWADRPALVGGGRV